MIVLRALDAGFARGATDRIAPFSLVLDAGGDARLHAATAREAAILARMCAAIVKPTVGTIYVGEYETRLQPPQAKRRVGFVDAAGFAGDAHAFACEIAFRAEVWGVPREAARARASAVLSAFAEEGTFARAAALALVADVSLVVLDRPPPGAIACVRAVAPAAGILATDVALANDRDAPPQLATAAP